MNVHQPNLLTYFLERVYVVTSLLLMLGALVGVYANMDQEYVTIAAGNTGGNTRYQIFSTGIYLIAAALILTRFEQFRWLCLRNKALVFLILLVALSFIWSIAPGATLRRAVSLVGTTLFAFYLVMRFRPEELIKLLAWAIGLAAVASLFMALAFPTIGVHMNDQHAGVWRGVFDFKTTFGRAMVLGVIVFLLLLMMTTKLGPAHLAAWIGLILCAGLVIMSESRTSWVTLTLLIVLLFVLRMLRNSRISLVLRFAMVALIFGAGGLFLLLNFFVEGLNLLGRDETLSSRTVIWSLAWEFGSGRPLLGHGYRVFWMEGGAQRLFEFIYFGSVSHAHNAFIDLWLDLGFVGVATFVATLAICVRRAMARLTTTRDPIGLWFPLFLAFMLLTSITEQTILSHGQIEWVLYVTTLLYLTVPVPQRQTLTSASPASVLRTSASPQDV